MRRIRLIVLSLVLALLPLISGFAATDYQCLQSCVSRGGLYLDCEARCTRITPSGPGAETQAPAPLQTPTGPQVPQAPKAPAAPVAAPMPKPVQPPPATEAPPRKAQSPGQQQQGSPTLPASTIDQRCVLLCKDKGHLYDYCAKICSH